MSLISNYPLTSPINSTYLPTSLHREYLSVVDVLADKAIKHAKEYFNEYQKSDFFDQKIALDILSSFTKNTIKEMTTLLTDQNLIKKILNF